ncbi:MAG: hypothetical protein IJM15_08995 [Erysipelotrichaceae bacterium]|nr:hypothetical protein [Erysipelotrichaceae bacterium]
MNESKWMMLFRLAERRMNIRDALEEMTRMYPKDEDIRRMNLKLVKGENITSALGAGRFERQLAFYCRHLPFSKALEVCLRQQKQKKKVSAEFVSSIGYQLVLGLCAILLLTLFSSVLFPQMVDMLEIDKQKTSGAMAFLKVLLTIRNLTVIFVILFSVFILYVVAFKRQIYVWMYLHRHKLDHLFKVAVTYRFAQKLSILLESGSDLHKCLDIMRFQLDQPLEGLLAHDLNESLLQGKDFESGMQGSYFDEDFHHLCLYGLKGDDLISGLKDYLAVTGLKIERMTKMTGYGIQAFCYVFIAMVMLCGYQILMLPLELLEGG